MGKWFETVLTAGTRMEAISGKSYTILKKIGEGAEGIVYKVRGPDKKEYAMKIYKKDRYKNLRMKYEHLIWLKAQKISALDEGFVEIEDIVFHEDKAILGCVMTLVEGYFVLPDIMDGRVDIGFDTLALLGYNLCKAIARLHKRGLVYLDISYTNILFLPNGSVKIIDTDNVVPNQQVSGILGTMHFIAPELLRGQRLYPARAQEDFALAVFLFLLVVSQHPYIGAKELTSEYAVMDKEALVKLMKDPVYLFDPNNNTNRPVPGEHDAALTYYPMLPEKVKELFRESLCDGIAHPSKRASAVHYMRVFQEMYLNTLECTCGAQLYFKEEESKQLCWHCQQTVSVVPKMKIRDKTILLFPNIELTEDVFVDFGDENKVVLEVRENPKIKGRYGLKNCTSDTWNLFSRSGNLHVVKPMHTVAISKDSKVKILRESCQIVS